MEGARRPQGGELAWGNRQQQATTKQSIEANRISGGTNADMHHAGPRGWAWSPEHAHSGPQAMLLGEGSELFDPRQQIGLLLLHQHPPAKGLLKTTATAMAVTARQHQGAWTHRCRALLKHGEIRLVESRTVDQHIAIAAQGFRFEQPTASPLAFPTWGKQPQSWPDRYRWPTNVRGKGLHRKKAEPRSAA
jgi:hypothetical protein